MTVISTDTERAGGIEQLAAFTRLLKISLLEIEDWHALRDTVSTQKSTTTIIVDTAGRNPYLEVERQELHQLIKAVGGEAILVLRPGSMPARRWR